MFVSTIPNQPSLIFAGKARLSLEVEHPNVASLEWAHKHRLSWKIVAWELTEGEGSLQLTSH